MGSCPGTFLNNKSKMTCDCRVFIIPQRSVKGKHLMDFQCENAVFKISPALFGRSPL